MSIGYGEEGGTKALKVVIMAGGKGTRFWPRSVDSKPKQFLALTSSETMLQLTYNRFLEWLPKPSVYVCTTIKYVSLVREQLPDLADDQIILEPDQRDTGPCTALIASQFLNLGDDEVLVTTPSDHYIPDSKRLMEALLHAEEAALHDRAIVTLGIKPTRAETGYGYIRTKAGTSSHEARLVETFIEKPSAEKAEHLIQQDNVYWNSGIFIWKPSTIAYYMSAYQPSLWLAISRSQASLSDIYSTLPKLSVDYAILEKAEMIYMIPVDFVWDDVGTWRSLERMHEADAYGNIVLGEVYANNSNNSIVYAENLKTVVLGVNDLIIIATQDGLLVCHKSNEQHIKTVLKALEDDEGGI